MKKIFYNLIITVILSAALTSCIKEVFPTGSSLTQAQVSGSESAMLSMIKAVPSSMSTSGTAGYASSYGDHTDFGLPGIHLRMEHMLEDLTTMAENPYYNRFYAYSMNLAQGYQYTYCAYFWDMYYTWIRLVNDVILSIREDEQRREKEGKERNEEDAVKINDILSQAYAYRAMCYLDLARLYEPKPNKYTEITEDIRYLTVPIVDENTTIDKNDKDHILASNNPRVSRQKIYEFILSDLNKAEELADPSTNIVSQPNIYAIYGLKARTYLELGYTEDGTFDTEEMFENAVEYAEKVLDGPYSPLTQSQWEDPVNGFNNADSNEAWIWCLKMSAENLNNLLTYVSHMSSEASWGYARYAQFGVSMRLYDQIPETDFRKHSWLDPEKEDYYDYKFAGDADDKHDFLYGMPAAKAYQSIKFRPAMGECSDFNVGNPADYCLMRIEEMHFIRMEALANIELAEGVEALQDFMKKHRDIKYNRNPESLQDFFTEMLLQKRVEFWGEGILMFDYKRLNVGITRSYPGSNHAGVFKLNTEGRSPQWNIVITRAEFQSNTAINKNNNNPDPTDKIELAD